MYHFVTGVTFFSNIKSFYEILFLNFFSTHVVSYRKNNENARNKLIVFYLMWQKKTVQ